MMNLYSNHGRIFIPFRLKMEVALSARCSIGGMPPTGITPSRLEGATRYFATLGLEDGIDVSIFTTFNHTTAKGPFDFFGGTYKLHDQSSALVQFVVHCPMTREKSECSLNSHLPALGFVFGPQGTDPECLTVEALGDPRIYSDHKIGGCPVFSQLEGEVEGTLDLLRNGYIHLLQLKMPSAAADTLIKGMWPFGESVFHVFARKIGNAFDFHYIWA